LSKYVEKEDLNGTESKTAAHFLNNTGLLNKKINENTSQSTSDSFNIKDSEEENELDLFRYEIQCELNVQGASDLVVDLFMSDTTNKVFKETVLLAIALLEGGNTQVQKTIYNRLLANKNSEKFFKTFHDRIGIAQKEIKSINSFMVTDINDGNALML
jgi:hypothetical protein